MARLVTRRSVLAAGAGSASDDVRDRARPRGKARHAPGRLCLLQSGRLVLKDKGWVEEEFGKDGTKVEWVLSLGSNKALEFLNGSVVDFGSTAGSAALLARGNGIPIKAVYIYSRPEWTALVTHQGLADPEGHRPQGQARRGHPRHRSVHLSAARARPLRHERERHQDGPAAASRRQDGADARRCRRLGRARPLYGADRARRRLAPVLPRPRRSTPTASSTCARPSPRSIPTRRCACSRSTSAAGNGRSPIPTGSKASAGQGGQTDRPGRRQGAGAHRPQQSGDRQGASRRDRRRRRGAEKGQYRAGRDRHRRRSPTS